MIELCGSTSHFETPAMSQQSLSPGPAEPKMGYTMSNPKQWQNVLLAVLKFKGGGRLFVLVFVDGKNKAPNTENVSWEFLASRQIKTYLFCGIQITSEWGKEFTPTFFGCIVCKKSPPKPLNSWWALATPNHVLHVRF